MNILKKNLLIITLFSLYFSQCNSGDKIQKNTVKLKQVIVTPDFIYLNSAKIKPKAKIEDIFLILGNPDRVIENAMYWDDLGVRLRKEKNSTKFTDIMIYLEVKENKENPKNKYTGHFAIKSAYNSKKLMSIQRECRGAFCRIKLKSTVIYFSLNMKTGKPGSFSFNYNK